MPAKPSRNNLFRRPKHHYIRHDPLIDEYEGRVSHLIGSKYNEIIREGALADKPRNRRSLKRNAEYKLKAKQRKQERKFKQYQMEIAEDDC